MGLTSGKLPLWGDGAMPSKTTKVTHKKPKHLDKDHPVSSGKMKATVQVGGMRTGLTATVWAYLQPVVKDTDIPTGPPIPATDKPLTFNNDDEKDFSFENVKAPEVYLLVIVGSCADGLGTGSVQFTTK